MKILVTGATGFVGGRLVQYFAERGHVVTGLSRDPGRAKQTVPWLQQVHRWDTRSHPPAEAFEGVDAVVHLAGESVAGRWSAKKRDEIRRSRIEGTRLLIEALDRLSARPRVLVSASAIGYYGDRGDEELVEEASAGDDFLAAVCRDWEREAQRAAELGMRVATLRTGIVLGPGGAARPLLLLTRLGLGGPLGSGRQWWSWIHLDDLVRLIEYAIEKELHGPVNATAPEPVRQREFARRLGRVLRRPAAVPTPAFALKVVLGGFSSELLGSRRVIPAKALESGFTFQYAGLDAALARLVQSRS